MIQQTADIASTFNLEGLISASSWKHLCGYEGLWAKVEHHIGDTVTYAMTLHGRQAIGIKYGYYVNMYAADKLKVQCKNEPLSLHLHAFLSFIQPK